MFSCEFCELSRNTFFSEHVWATASALKLPLFHRNLFLSGFKHKGGLFNDFFSNQCSLIINNSKLPTNLKHVTDRRLSLVTFSAGDITEIIQNVNSNKAYEHDNFRIWMFKICGDTVNNLF